MLAYDFRFSNTKQDKTLLKETKGSTTKKTKKASKCRPERQIPRRPKNHVNGLKDASCKKRETNIFVYLTTYYHS